MVTIKDIAREADVSPSTVSRVLSNKKDFFNPATAAKVRKIAKKLGYRKNTLAANLVKKKNNIIVVVISSVETNFSDQIIKGIQSEAQGIGYDIMYMYTHTTNEEEHKHILETLISRQISGILFVSVILEKENITLLDAAKIPYIFVSIKPDNEHMVIGSDDQEIGYLATKYLINLGHKIIGLAGVDAYPYAGFSRIKGYQRALDEFGIEANEKYIFYGDYSYNSGSQAIKYYHENFSSLTGIVAASDSCATGILNYAYDHKIKIPEEYSIITIDGTNLCNITRPRLTSVTQNFRKMGSLGVRKLIKLMEGKVNTKNKSIFVPVKIDVRSSTARLTR
ncbi:LacI family transcriptional regulator [Lactobacillus colini]|uniref:LacI family transcriptional regulator n=1 Tax=Lactobacillus colini TaxID=1819254 RepID=A0ABS4MGQ7_9LACO|nr:LacI family DNA-binding transcriptional regulator [Lactobacillus colini]MBP2058502.1 LacI family transcriptional regulator [Lactobacillus colini]